jgi:hypothetical protein
VTISINSPHPSFEVSMKTMDKGINTNKLIYKVVNPRDKPKPGNTLFFLLFIMILLLKRKA